VRMDAVRRASAVASVSSGIVVHVVSGLVKKLPFFYPFCATPKSASPLAVESKDDFWADSRGREVAQTRAVVPNE
jgi:hypothetical protein